MRSTLRRATVNKTLLVVLAVVGVAAVGYWVFFRPEPTTVQDAALEKESRALRCKKCGKVQITGKEARDIATDPKTGKLKCPKCQQFTAEWPGAAGVKLGGG